MLTATEFGADNNYGDDEAIEDILKLWKTEDADEPSEDHEEDIEDDEDASENDEDDSDTDAQDEPSEDDESEQDEEDESEGEDEDPKDKKVLKNTDVVKVKVGDTEEEVPVSKLTRLYGQEKALTQRSMEVAEQRKTLEGLTERHVAAADGLAQRARARVDEYAKVDWALAAAKMEPEDYASLRQEAASAYQEYQFYAQEVDTYLEEIKKFRHKENIDKAQKTIKALSDPKTGIPGFNEKLYSDIRDYAVKNGMAAESFGEIVDELPLRLMHKAMLYDRGTKAVTKKVEKNNKKIVKSRASSAVTRETFSKGNQQAALKRLRSTGSTEDAEAALMERWARADD